MKSNFEDIFFKRFSRNSEINFRKNFIYLNILVTVYFHSYTNKKFFLSRTVNQTNLSWPEVVYLFRTHARCCKRNLYMYTFPWVDFFFGVYGKQQFLGRESAFSPCTRMRFVQAGLKIKGNPTCCSL